MSIEGGRTMGETLEPLLIHMEDALWHYEYNCPATPYGFSEEAFRASIKLFMAAMMDKIWALQENEEMDIEDRAAMAEKCGKDIRAFVKTYTNIDTHELYGNE